MNHLQDVIKHSTLSLYSDDSKIFRSIKELEGCKKMSGDMVRLEKWLANWQLKLKSIINIIHTLFGAHEFRRIRF